MTTWTSALEAVTQLPLVSDLGRALDRQMRALVAPPPAAGLVDFRRPEGDPGVHGPDSMAWRVHANPIPMFVGGVSAVFLELAEPRVRSGVWDHTDFRRDPVGRMKRTGFAAMVTTYASTADVERVTSRVRKMHDGVRGETPDGVPYEANDPELLRWVHVTAVHSFLRAWKRYVNPTVSAADENRYFAETAAAADHFGFDGAPRTRAEAEALIDEMLPNLVPHPILSEFQELVENAPTLGWAATPLQRLLVQAAIDLVPARVRRRIGYGPADPLRLATRPVVRSLALAAQPLVATGIPAQACRRVGKPSTHLLT